MLIWPGASWRSAEGKPRLGLLGAVAFTLALTLPSAHAQTRGQPAPHKTILLVRTVGDDPAMNRVRADLSGAGWRIIEIVGQDENEARESLATLASELRATAALRIDTTTGQITLHIGRAWGSVDEVLRSEDGRVDGRILALRATEALRAHGLDVAPTALADTGNATQTETPAPLKPARPAADRGAAPRRARAAPRSAVESATAPKHGLWLELAPAAVGSPGGLGYDLGGWMGARLELSPLWSVAAAGIVPVWSRRVVEPEGTARVATSLLGVGLEGAWLRRQSCYWATGVAAAGLATVMQGRQAAAGYRTARDTVSAVAAELYARGGWRLEPDWTLFGAVLVGVSTPTVRVGFGDHIVRTWGQPYGALALGAAFRPLAW
jgi:hypothetical protein